jgi:predicted outer membrane protein
MPPRPTLRAVVLATAIALLLAAAAALLPAPAAAAHGENEKWRSEEPTATDADRAALTPADRDLLEKVRLAGLWEHPAGRMAVEKGVSERVREIGRMIAEQHAELDQLVVDAANVLEVPLPDEPMPEQQWWLTEMEQATGRDFDRIFVDRLRAAHGKILPAIAVVRTGTRVPAVRALAIDANVFVSTHLELLESTGLVDYASLPEVPVPAPEDRRFVLLGDPRFAADPLDAVRQTVVLALLALAALVLVVLVARIAVPGRLHRVSRPADPHAHRGRRRPPAPDPTT